jgi:hypothetical protein
LKCIIGRFDSGDVREQPKIVNVARRAASAFMAKM